MADCIVREAIQSLYDEGLLVKALDGEGRPVLRVSSTGEFQQVYKHCDAATPEERDFWRNEHPVN